MVTRNVLVTWSLIAGMTRLAMAEPNFRRYEDGPLTVADFQADAPKNRTSPSGVPLHAFSVMETHYNHRYRTLGRNSRWQATLESIEIFAVVHRDQSWNIQRENKELLDHEQGHFDVQHVWALRARQKFAELNNGTKKLTGVGKTEKEAISDLERRIRDTMQPFLDATTAAQKNYDQVTNHAGNKAAQAEQRQVQSDAIAAAERSLKKNKK